MAKPLRKSFSTEELEQIYHRLEDQGMAVQDFGIRIDRDGNWFHQGGLMQRTALVRMLAGLMLRLSDGSYWLVNPGERGRIEVEDAPFIATTALINGDGADQTIDFVTNTEEQVPLDAEHPLRVEEGVNADEPRPYIRLRGRLDARLGRQAFYDMVEHAEERDGVFGVMSYGQFFPLAGDADNEGA